jgi:hypothetical protein
MRLRPEQLDRFKEPKPAIREEDSFTDEEETWDVEFVPEGLEDEDDEIEVGFEPEHRGVGFDFDLKKFLLVAAMFAIMFVIPVGIYQNRANLTGQQQVYTQNVTDQTGRVAGASTAQTPQLQQTATVQPQTANVAGIPLSTLFVVGGILLILVPVFVIWKL